jgi:hypothetical protein
MPLEYTIVPAKRLVISRDTLPLTRRDIIQFFRDLSADPRFEPTFNQLGHIHAGALTAMRYKDLSTAQQFDPFASSSKRAMVVHTKGDSGMVHIYETLQGGSIRAFESEQEAWRFLGLSFDDDPSSHTGTTHGTGTERNEDHPSRSIGASHERQRLFLHNLANKLNILIGNCDLLAENIPENSSLRRRVMVVRDAANAMAKEVQDFRVLQRQRLRDPEDDAMA